MFSQTSLVQVDLNRDWKIQLHDSWTEYRFDQKGAQMMRCQRIAGACSIYILGGEPRSSSNCINWGFDTLFVGISLVAFLGGQLLDLEPLMVFDPKNPESVSERG
jgi:hypothetical protein